MPGLARSALLDASLETDSRGRWILLDREAKGDAVLVQMIEEFEPLPVAAGVRAGEWLREDAFDNDPLTRTRVLVTDKRVEGFIATCFGSVDLTGGGRKRLPVPRRLQRQQVPAFLVCWIARHRESEIPGMQLMLTALGLAREAKRNSGLVALALDPHDEEASAVWQGEPWYFRKCKQRSDGRPSRLYLPI